jgi:hypothetical protein
MMSFTFFPLRVGYVGLQRPPACKEERHTAALKEMLQVRTAQIGTCCTIFAHIDRLDYFLITSKSPFAFVSRLNFSNPSRYAAHKQGRQIAAHEH